MRFGQENEWVTPEIDGSVHVDENIPVGSFAEVTIHDWRRGDVLGLRQPAAAFSRASRCLVPQQAASRKAAARLPQSMGNHSPSFLAISSYSKLVIVLSHAGLTAFAKLAALHHFQSDPFNTSL